MGFYDAKGYWRNDGEGFYDAKGNWVNPGSGFYDSKGYFRSPGDGFYDARGNWVNPEGAFYDGKGYIRSGGIVASSKGANTGENIVAAIGFILFIPIALLCGINTFLVEWFISHLYIVFAGYLILNLIFCLIITKIKKHQGINFALSFIGNYTCILSFIYIVLLYAVPYVILNGGFFDFVLILAFGVGGIAVVQFFNYYHEKPVLEFIVGIVFFLIVIFLIKNGVKEMHTMESLAEIYGLEVSALFKLLFGFAV